METVQIERNRTNILWETTAKVCEQDLMGKITKKKEIYQNHQTPTIMEKTKVKSAWTSKVLTALLLMFTAVMFVACSPANSIKGHTYFAGTSDNGKKIYFSPSGAAQITYYDQGSTTTFLHLNYTIKGEIVEIYFDYSDYWKLEAQGTLAEHYVYDKETDILVSDDGLVLHRLQ